MFYDVPQEEHSEKDGWWINELESLGVDTKSSSNGLKNKQENRDLVEDMLSSRNLWKSISKLMINDILIPYP